MNRRQRRILIGGALLLATSSLFPPVHHPDTSSDAHLPTMVKGRGFLLVFREQSRNQAWRPPIDPARQHGEWVLIAALTVSAVLATDDYWRRSRGLCVRCGYDLTGNTSGRCPECGAKRSSRG